LNWFSVVPHRPYRCFSIRICTLVIAQ